MNCKIKAHVLRPIAAVGLRNYDGATGQSGSSGNSGMHVSIARYINYWQCLASGCILKTMSLMVAWQPFHPKMVGFIHVLGHL